MTNSQSTIEIGINMKLNEEEIRRLEKRLNDLGIDKIDMEEVQRRRNEAAGQVPFKLSLKLVALSLINPRKLAKDLVLTMIGILGPEMLNTMKEAFQRGREIDKIDQSKLDLPGYPMGKSHALLRFLEEKKLYFEENSLKKFEDLILETYKDTGKVLRIEDIIERRPEIDKYFDEEIKKQINDAVNQTLSIREAAKEAAQNLSLDDLAKPTVDFVEFGAGLLQEQERQIEIFKSLKNLGLDFGSEFSDSTESIIERTNAIDDEIQKKTESIQLHKEDNQNLIDLGNNQGVVIASTKQLTENIEGRSESLRVGNEILDLTAEELLNLPGKLAMVNGAFIDTTASQTEFSSSLENLVDKSQDGAVIFGYTKEELLGLGSATSEAAEKTKDLDKNALKGVADQAGKAEETLGTLNSTTGDLSAQSKELVGAQENVAQAVADGSAVMDNAGASAEKFGEALEQVESSGGFFDGIKQGFIDFVENVESNSELMADFFANTLTEMSQNFSDLFYNVLTGKFDSLQDLAKQAFEAILRAFLDMVAAIATRQIVISIAASLGLTGKAGATDYLGLGKQALGIGGDLAGLFSGGSSAASAIGGGISTIGSGAGSAIGAIGAGMGGISSAGASVGGVMTAGAQAGTFFTPAMEASIMGTGPLVEAGGGILATIGTAVTVVGAVIAAAALAYTIIAPLLKKTPRLDIDFDSIKTEAGRRAALVSEILDDDFLKDEIIDISVKRKAGLGLGGDEGIKEVMADAIRGAVDNLLDIINKLPTDLANTLTEELLNTPLDTETVVAGERLFEFDAKGKKIAEKFNQLINGEIQAKFLFAVDGFLQTMFESLGVLPEAAKGFLDERFREFENAGSREARAAVGQELLADLNAFVDAFNIVSGNVNDTIGQTIQTEECEYRMAA